MRRPTPTERRAIEMLRYLHDYDHTSDDELKRLDEWANELGKSGKHELSSEIRFLRDRNWIAGPYPASVYITAVGIEHLNQLFETREDLSLKEERILTFVVESEMSFNSSEIADELGYKEHEVHKAYQYLLDKEYVCEGNYYDGDVQAILSTSKGRLLVGRNFQLEHPNTPPAAQQNFTFHNSNAAINSQNVNQAYTESGDIRQIMNDIETFSGQLDQLGLADSEMMPLIRDLKTQIETSPNDRNEAISRWKKLWQATVKRTQQVAFTVTTADAMITLLTIGRQLADGM